MSPLAAVGSGVMNHPGTSPASEIINRMSARRALRIWRRGAGSAWGAGNTQKRGAFNYLLLSSWGSKLRKKSQICREHSKAHNFDHSETMAVIFFTDCWVCQLNPRIKRRTPTWGLKLLITAMPLASSAWRPCRCYHFDPQLH